MALTVKDIMELPCGQKMTLAAGSRGLNRPVTTAEIASEYVSSGGLRVLTALPTSNSSFSSKLPLQ